MQFNIDKCVVMNMGRGNEQNEYMLGNKKLRKSNKERDLGIIVDNL